MKFLSDAWHAVTEVVSTVVNIAVAPVVVPFKAAQDIFIDGKPVAEAATRGFLGTNLATGGYSGAANVLGGGIKLAEKTPGLNKATSLIDKVTFGGINDLKSGSNLVTKLGAGDAPSREEALSGSRGIIWSGARVGAAYGVSAGVGALGTTASAVVGKSALDLASGKDPTQVLTNAFAPSAAPYVQAYKDIIAPYAPAIDAASQFFPTSNPNAPQGSTFGPFQQPQSSSAFPTTANGLSGDLRDVFLNDNTGKYLMYASVGLGALYLLKRGRR